MTEKEQRKTGKELEKKENSYGTVSLHSCLCYLFLFYSKKTDVTAHE